MRAFPKKKEDDASSPFVPSPLTSEWAAAVATNHGGGDIMREVRFVRA
jgi:hypothetical protein